MDRDRPSPLTALLWCGTALLTAYAVWAHWPRSQTPGNEAGVERPVDVDLDTFEAAPPVPGPPEPAELELAIERGTQAYRERFVEPWLQLAEQGGVLDYTDASGSTRHLGPGVYVQCQLYLLVHLLMYQREFGIPDDDPQLVRVRNWFRSTFDETEGRWPWSEEGCLHAKSMIVLASAKDPRFESAWGWALQSDSFRRCTVNDLFSIQRSGKIVQTLGPADLSLTGEFQWEHPGGPVPDEENTAKYLYALLRTGRDPDSAEVAGLRESLSKFLVETQRPLGIQNTKDLIGRAWTVLATTHFRLPPDDGYRLSLANLRAALRGEWRSNFLLRSIPLFRALFARALIDAGERGPELDAWIHGFVADQNEDGAWRVPHVNTVWSLSEPPATGIKTGNMDGAVTYMVTLALIAYRDRDAP